MGHCNSDYAGCCRASCGCLCDGCRHAREAREFSTPDVPKEEAPWPINHPPHYAGDNGIECIAAIRAALGLEGFRAFLRGQVIKYTWRGPKKGTEALCYGKAKWYADRLAETFAEGK